jgi:transcriptional regulator with XRE-family HTH domain
MITHIGNKIKTVCKEKHISVPKLAEKLGYSSPGLYRALAQPDISLNLLQRISKELDHNFFQYYFDDTNPLTKAEKVQLTNAANMAKHENELLRFQVNILSQTNKVLSEQLQYFLTPAKEIPTSNQSIE